MKKQNPYDINVELIEKYLIDNKPSKAEFCRRCNIGIDTLNRILTGRSFMLDALFKIAKVMKIRLCEIFV